MASTLTTLYQASQSYDWQVHGITGDGTYLYIVLFNRTAAGQTCWITKARASDMAVIGSTQWDSSYRNAFQSICCDGTYLYISIVTTNAFSLPSSGDVIRIACSSIGASSPAATHAVQTSYGPFGPQGIFYGPDANGAQCAYQLQNYSTTSNGFVTKLFASDLSYVSGAASYLYNAGNIRLMFDGLVDTDNSNTLYIWGGSDSSSKVGAYIARLRQTVQGSTAIIDNGGNSSQLTITTGLEGGDLGTGSGITMARKDPSDSSIMWAVGWTTKSSGSTYGDVLLLRINISGSTLSLTHAWRIAHSSELSYRGFGLIVDSSYVYISTGIFPHSDLGTDEWSKSSFKSSILRLEKSSLVALSGSSTIANLSSTSLARTYSNGGGSGRITLVQMYTLSGDSTNLYVCASQDFVGNGAKLSSGILKFPRNLDAATGTLFDSAAKVKEFTDSANITITPIGSSLSVVESRPSVSATNDPSSWSISLTNNGPSNVVTSIDQTTLLEVIKPTGAGSNTDIRYVTYGDGQSAHWQTQQDGSDSSIVSSRYGNTSPPDRDLYAHSYTATPNGRITRVVISVRASFGATSATNRLGVSWKIGSNGEQTYFPASGEAGYNVTTAYATYDIEITNVSGAPTTWDDIHNMQFGPYLKGYSANYLRVTETTLKVYWEPYNFTSMTGNGGTVIGGEATWKRTLPISATIPADTLTGSLALRNLIEFSSTIATISSTNTPTLSVERSLTSTTAVSIATSSPNALIDRPLSSAIATTSATASLNIAVDRPIDSTIAAISATDSVPITYSIAFTSAIPVISTTNTPTLSIGHPLTATIPASSNTNSPDASIARSLSSTIPVTATTGTPSLTIGNNVPFSASIQTTISTSALIIAIDRSITASDAAQTATNTPTLAIERPLSSSISAILTTSDVDLDIASVSSLSATIPTTIDTSTPILSIARDLSSTISSVSSTSSPTITLETSITSAITAASSTSDVTLDIAGVSSLTSAISTTTSTSTPIASIARELSAQSSLTTNTGTPILNTGIRFESAISAVSLTSVPNLFTGLLLAASISPISTTSSVNLEVFIELLSSITGISTTSLTALLIDRPLSSSIDTTLLTDTVTLAIPSLGALGRLTNKSCTVRHLAERL